MKQKQQVVHIHGGTPFASYDLYLQALKEWEIKLDDSFREKRWSRNYDAFLNPDRYQCIRPIMPSKSNPKYLEWVIWFEKLLPHLRDKVIFVGHSLGGIFLAKYLSEHILPITISQLHLVAAPYDCESDRLTSLDTFILTEFPKDFIKNNIDHIHLYFSKDDTQVSFIEAQKYKEALPEATLHIFEDRGHFLSETFPELFENIKEGSEIS
jgi:predicted alpha/beta hydrolase family esterase